MYVQLPLVCLDVVVVVNPYHLIVGAFRYTPTHLPDICMYVIVTGSLERDGVTEPIAEATMLVPAESICFAQR